MKIINHTINIAFNGCSRKPLLGLIIGPTRLILAITQIALNVLLLPFAFIANAFYGFDRTSCFYFKNILRDLAVGGLHIPRAILDFLPFSSLYISKENDNKIELAESDCPFYFVTYIDD